MTSVNSRPNVAVLSGTARQKDAQMMAGIAASRNDSVQAFMNAYGKLIRGIVGRRFNPRSTNFEDCVENVFVRIWRKAGQYDPKRAPLTAWVSQITQNICMDRLRQVKKERAKRSHRDIENIADDDGESCLLAENPECSVLEKLEVKSNIDGALQSLPPFLQEAVLLAGCGATYEQIAEITGRPMGTVKSKLTKQRRCVLRDMAKEADIPDDTRDVVGLLANGGKSGSVKAIAKARGCTVDQVDRMVLRAQSAVIHQIAERGAKRRSA